MSIIIFVLNVVLILAFTVCVLSFLKLRNLPDYLLAAFIIAYADIILVMEIAGLLASVNRLAVMVLQIIFTASSLILWLRRRRPRLLRPFSNIHLGRFVIDSDFIFKIISTALMACAVAYVYFLAAQHILAVFPSNYDSLTYHLSRIGYWLQYQSFFPWPTPNIRQTTYPMNAELGVLWTILWWGTDRLSGFVQWITVPVIMLGIFRLTRLSGYSRWQSGITSLLWATLIQVLYQSLTTQNDLVTTSFWIAALSFFIAGLHDGTIDLTFLSGIAFGLAIGTKGTSIIILPGLGLALAVFFFLHRNPGEFRKNFFRWCIASLLGVVLLGSYVYIQNSFAFGNPLGPSTGITKTEFASGDGIKSYAHRLFDNLGRYTYQFVDFSPLPFQLASSINPAKATLFAAIFHWLRISVENRDTISTSHFDLNYINPLNEDTSWFGPLAALLIPAAILQIYLGVRKRIPLRIFLVLIGFGFLVVESAVEQWTPYKGRYFMIPVALCFPSVACFLGTGKAWRTTLSGFVIVFGLTVMGELALNSNLLGNASRGQPISNIRSVPVWGNEFNYYFFEQSVPSTASIGLLSDDNFRDYPLFGEHFTHRVTLAVPEEETLNPRINIGPFETDFQHSDYIYLTHIPSQAISNAVFRDYSPLIEAGTNSIWIRNDLRPPDYCDGDTWPFTEIFKSSIAEICPRFPIHPGVTSGGAAGTIYLQDGHFIPVISTERAGQLAFDLLVRNSTIVKISILISSPKSPDTTTFELSISNKDIQPQLSTATFSGTQTLGFIVPLHAGINTMRLGIADGPIQARVLKIELAAQ